MAKRTYRKISSYLSYKYFSRVNREKWKEDYKERTGRETARGWQFSEEYKKFQDSQKGRVKTYAERNPAQFFEKKDTILKRSGLTDSQKYVFSDTPTPGAQLLNPMKGKDQFGPARIFDFTKERGARQGKQTTTIFRVTAPGLLPGSQVATSQSELEAIRGDLMKSYGANVAAVKEKGTYGLIGANYSVEYHETGGSMLAVVDVEMFLY